MPSIWMVLVFIALFILFMRVLKSLVRGCLTTLFVVIVVVVIVALIRSTKAPVYVGDRYIIENFKVRKLQ